jgi:hypothetical protein
MYSMLDPDYSATAADTYASRLKHRFEEQILMAVAAADHLVQLG